MKILLKRGEYLSKIHKTNEISSNNLIKDGNNIPVTQQEILNAIFASPRKNNERSATRTITITISDKCQD